MSLLVFCLVLGAIVYFFMTYHNRHLQQVLASDVVSVNGAQDRYPNLPFGMYGVPHRFHSPDRIQIIFPQLAESGEVEYIYSWHSLNAVTPVTLSQHAHNNARTSWYNVASGSLSRSKTRVMAELAPLIKEHLRLEFDAIALENQYLKLNKLADLVSTSDVYSPMLSTYDRAIDETEKLMKKIDELGKVYVRIVRETLIGLKIAEFDPDSLIDLHIPLDEQYDRIKSEYQLMKDSAHAYLELMRESRGINGV